MFKWILNLLRNDKLTKDIFLEFLVKKEAPGYILSWAQKQSTARGIIEKCQNIDHLYWLIGAIGIEIPVKFLNNLWLERNSKEDLLRSEYKKQVVPLENEIRDRQKKIQVEYNVKMAPLRNSYRNKHTPIERPGFSGKMDPQLINYCSKRAVIDKEYWDKLAAIRSEIDSKLAPIEICYNKNLASIHSDCVSKFDALARKICTFEKAKEVILSQLNQPKE